MNVATIIHNQIQAIDAAALWAWGSKDFVNTGDGLQFKTSGLSRWKGIVHITLDAAADLYNIKFYRIRKATILVDKHIEGVLAEDLVEYIDMQVG